ncbi:hypothetical protein GCM10023089_23600 [Quisquiliibacterium transsilvanicum]|uniref:Catechol 2,3-dioxygenase-like lactoylglutathione lyase family enzyme n=1 Tax=Quisquiliibacterium transsilvanicum TaxID=1549638 RepID=A0A7W8HKN2_9BURK|nr:catechol 2,3-dioxygenase-like lactoylglutathione lyase family enzyme [Quisquiliibacterium transsilvanicum]
MFDHIGFGVSNLAESKSFFLEALAPLKVALVMEGPFGIGIGQDNKPSLWLHQSQVRPAPLHIAFVAASRVEVDAFHKAAFAAGGKDNGAPGLRPHWSRVPRASPLPAWCAHVTGQAIPGRRPTQGKKLMTPDILLPRAMPGACSTGSPRMLRSRAAVPSTSIRAMGAMLRIVST